MNLKRKFPRFGPNFGFDPVLGERVCDEGESKGSVGRRVNESAGEWEHLLCLRPSVIARTLIQCGDGPQASIITELDIPQMSTCKNPKFHLCRLHQNSSVGHTVPAEQPKGSSIFSDWNGSEIENVWRGMIGFPGVSATSSTPGYRSLTPFRVLGFGKPPASPTHQPPLFPSAASAVREGIFKSERDQFRFRGATRFAACHASRPQTAPCFARHVFAYRSETGFVLACSSAPP
jgi:hypothetical protein